MRDDALLLCFDDELDAAARIAEAAGIGVARIERHRFPDGELRLRLPAAPPARVVVLRTLDHRTCPCPRPPGFWSPTWSSAQPERLPGGHRRIRDTVVFALGRVAR